MLAGVEKYLSDLFLEPNLANGKQPVGAVRLNPQNAVVAALGNALKNFYVFDANGARCLITGNHHAVYGNGVTFDAFAGAITSGNNVDYIALPISRDSTSNGMTFLVECEKVSGSVSWSFLDSGWTGVYSTDDNSFTSTTGSSFDGNVTITDGGFQRGVYRRAAFTHRGTDDMAGSLDGSDVVSDSSVQFPTVTVDEITLGLAKKSFNDNPSVTRFKAFAFIDGEVADWVLRELSANPWQMFESTISLPGLLEVTEPLSYVFNDAFHRRLLTQRGL
jgi:hypothetical protein